MDAIKLSPSELTFLWDECPRCFYLKVTGRFSRPSTAFPSIFSSIDRAMKNHYRDRSMQELSPDLPPGRFFFSEQFIVSQPVTRPGHRPACLFRRQVRCAAGIRERRFRYRRFQDLRSQGSSHRLLCPPAGSLCLLPGAPPERKTRPLPDHPPGAGVLLPAHDEIRGRW